MASFAIEVPGETVPLSEQQLIQTLQSAASSKPAQIQTGTKQLGEWEHRAGYYRHLQGAYIDQRLPVELRYLAIIQLKNGIDKYWRKTATNAVSKQDKEVIRARLLSSCVNEPDDRLALQSALVVAKVARFEYPNDWPDLISTLVQRLRSQVPPLQLARLLLILLHIVKELSTARLQRSRQTLQSATPELVHVLSSVYSDAVRDWQSDASARSSTLALMALKVLRRLLVVGYEHPNRNPEVVQIWTDSQQHLNFFLQQQATEKLALQLSKLHHQISKEHPAAFALLPGSLDLARAYWGIARHYGETMNSGENVQTAVADARIGADGDADEKPTTEKLALRGLLIMRACVKMVHSPAQTFKYRTPEDKEEKYRATELVRQELLSTKLVQEMMETLVTKFFVFRASDLREWEEEPEEWEKREEGDGEDWEFSVRSCSEKLFLDLAINYKEMLVQPLLQLFYSVASLENEDVMVKDSIYTAIGLAAPVVFEQLDFDAFIRSVLANEVRKQKPGFSILRRRAAILLGQWITIKITERQLVYQIFRFLLGKEDPLNDQVVRVTAGRQLAKIIDDWETKADDLLPFVDDIISRLMSLIDEVELTETKMALLNTVSVLVERMEHRITPYAERIMSPLPGLWEAAGDEGLMKQGIITTLTRLINAMKAESQPLLGMVLPIIDGVMQSGNAILTFFLLEDIMDLWAAVLVQMTPPASEGALSLVSRLGPLYESGGDTLRKALEITESYLFLAPEWMLSPNARLSLFAGLADVFASVKSKAEANGMVCNILELAIRQSQRLGGEVAVRQTTADLIKSGIMPALLEGLHGSWSAHCTTGPRAKEPPVDGIVETDYFAVLARLALGSLSSFSEVLTQSTTSASENSTSQNPMKWLLEEWFSHFENIGDPSRRKLMVLAFTKLLERNEFGMLSNLQSLMTVWTDVLTELREDAADAGGDSLVYVANPEVDPLESPEDARRRILTYSDDVHAIKLPEFVHHHLGQALAACGGPERFQEEWLVNVDKDVVQAFSALGIM